MTTDFRALCAELVESVEVLLEMRSPNAGRMWTTERRLRVARAALADEPAVPEGREPVAVTGQPSDEELTRLWFETDGRAVLGAKEYARAVLARWGNLKARVTSSTPADGEVAELVAKLGKLCSDLDYDDRGDDAACCYRAAELLQRLSPPQPVPVSERLPAMVTDGLRVAGDCDEQGRCWAGTWASVDTSGDRDIDLPPSWELREVCAQDDVWLPAHALPVPEVK